MAENSVFRSAIKTLEINKIEKLKSKHKMSLFCINQRVGCTTETKHKTNPLTNPCWMRKLVRNEREREIL